MGDRPTQPSGDDPSPVAPAPVGIPPPPPPRPAKSRRRRRLLWILLPLVVIIGGLLAFAAIVDEALTNELIQADFTQGAAPFEVSETPRVTYDVAEGSYRFTIKNTDGLVTSLGDFVRTAYAVGIRAEIVEMAEPGTTVGTMCLGPAEGVEGLAGYGFLAEPGGNFALARMEEGGKIKFLERGNDAGIQEIHRVSITCVPNGPEPAAGGSTDVTVTGYIDGVEIATSQDPDGYDTYTYAGLTVAAEQVGTQVRFTAVQARVPDQEWTP